MGPTFKGHSIQSESVSSKDFSQLLLSSKMEGFEEIKVVQILEFHRDLTKIVAYKVPFVGLKQHLINKNCDRALCF